VLKNYLSQVASVRKSQKVGEMEVKNRNKGENLDKKDKIRIP